MSVAFEQHCASGVGVLLLLACLLYKLFVSVAFEQHCANGAGVLLLSACCVSGPKCCLLLYLGCVRISLHERGGGVTP